MQPGFTVAAGAMTFPEILYLQCTRGDEAMVGPTLAQGPLAYPCGQGNSRNYSFPSLLYQ